MERIQKILANAGFCSRRKAEGLIAAGKVIVNNEVAKLGDKAGPDDIIMVGNKQIVADERRYIAFYKPSGVMTSLKDPSGKRLVADLLGSVDERVFPVGRLDYDAEGLLVLTNDGDFGNILLHPRYETDKTYLASLDGKIKKRDLIEIRGKIRLNDGYVNVKKISVQGNNVLITIHEGRNKIVKRIFKKLGYRVNRLKRVQVGPIKLGRMKPGEFRDLTQKEIDAVWKIKDMPPRAPRHRSKNS